MVATALLAALVLQQPPPIRILVLLGGEHHAFEANSKTLLDGLKADGLSIKEVVVRIDNPPPGKPAAEPATIPSNPDILKDPTLNDRFDVIVQYTQDSYLDLITSDHIDGLLHFVRNGGGWIGIHCAADTFKAVPEYVRMIGGKFESHPPYGPLSVRRIATLHPVGDGIADFDTKDEFYHLAESTAANKDLLLAGVSPGDGKLRPIAWSRRYDMGKVFMTVLGHGPDTYAAPMFRKMMKQAVTWAAEKELTSFEKNGSISLFNGRNLDGWTMTGPGSFSIEDGAVVSRGGMGLLWYSKRAFRDFVLELEWKAERKESNSGVFVRFPSPATPWSAVNEGYEIQICDSEKPKHNTGSIYSFQEPSQIPTKPAGEWNQYRIEVKGQDYVISINGEVVNRYKGSRSLEGFIGLQNHSDADVVRFRNLRVAELRP